MSDSRGRGGMHRLLLWIAAPGPAAGTLNYLMKFSMSTPRKRPRSFLNVAFDFYAGDDLSLPALCGAGALAREVGSFDYASHFGTRLRGDARPSQTKLIPLS